MRFYLRLLLLILPAVFPLFSAAQESGTAPDSGDGYRLFTPKEGKQVEARLVGVSRDWKVMEIQTREGASFKTPVVKLILDDQQFVKDWLKNQPLKSDYNLDVKIERKFDKGERIRQGPDYVYQMKPVFYEIHIRNLSNEVLPAPKVEWVVLRKERCNIYQSDGSWTYTDYDASTRATAGEQVLEDLNYNREKLLTTDGMRIDQVFGDGNVLYAEDHPLGVIVRVSTAQGALVGEYRSSEEGNKNIPFETAVKMAKGDGGGENSGEYSSAPRGEKVYKLLKGESIEGPIDIKNRTVEFKAKVSPSGKGDGVIFAVGGKLNGMALSVQDRQLILSHRVNEQLKTVTAKLPLGEFDVEARATGKELTILLNGRDSVQGEGGGDFPSECIDGIDIGMDGGTSLVGNYPPRFQFAGTIREAQLKLGADPAD